MYKWELSNRKGAEEVFSITNTNEEWKSLSFTQYLCIKKKPEYADFPHVRSSYNFP